jgi:hypothetical protein
LEYSNGSSNGIVTSSSNGVAPHLDSNGWNPSDATSPFIEPRMHKMEQLHHLDSKGSSNIFNPSNATTPSDGSSCWHELHHFKP